MIESPRKTHEVTMMVNGNPSGAIILALGSSSVFHMVDDLGNSRWASTTSKTSKGCNTTEGSPAYRKGSPDPTVLRSEYGRHSCYSVDRCFFHIATGVLESFQESMLGAAGHGLWKRHPRMACQKCYAAQQFHGNPDRIHRKCR